jgi:hypothetical protein
MNEYAEEDIGNIVSLEHINVQVPDQSLATVFYVVGMGFTRDPYLNVGTNNMWVNVGEQQFHLPTRAPQVIAGHAGMVLPDLDALETRLNGIAQALKGTMFSFARSSDCVRAISPWGNEYRCYEPRREFGDMTLGIPYVEFLVPTGATAGILRFYQSALGAPVKSAEDQEGPFGLVQIGRYQSLRFRETNQTIAPYDGHHVAVYVANFSAPYAYLKSRGLISEEVRNHQFLFKDMLDPQDQSHQFTLEHEVRSLKHPMYHRPFVNRDPRQSQRGYRRGWDAFTPFQN